ncbi:MAG: transporter [Segatella salivae]
MGIIKFIKQWTLLCAIVFGSIVYLVFTHVAVLTLFGDYIGPKLVMVLPINIFLMLYVTFCKIQMNDLTPRKWHFILQGIRTLLAALSVVAANLCTNPTYKLLWEGVFICAICPTAAAAPVIVDKLGDNIASLTVYLLIANGFTSIIIPLFFPLMEKGADITFAMAAWLVLQRVLMVLIIPLCLALLSRKYLPKFVTWLKTKRNLAFYLWSFNLSIIMGLAMQNILHAPVSGWVLTALCIIPLILAVVQFSIGKLVGHRYGDSIGAGQALGQKNTVVGIWLTLSFLNPYAAIAPCVYVIWQNIINAVQLWYKDKYGYLKW